MTFAILLHIGLCVSELNLSYNKNMNFESLAIRGRMTDHLPVYDGTHVNADIRKTSRPPLRHFG